MFRALATSFHEFLLVLTLCLVVKPQAVLRVAFDTELPVLPEPNNVCFKSAKHPGSKRWREVVNSFADNTVDYPTWTDDIFSRVRQVLADENIVHFLVSRDVHGKPSAKINQGYWYEAAESVILYKTKQRFLDYRKHKKRRLRQDDEETTRSPVRREASGESIQSQASTDASEWPTDTLTAHFQSLLSELVKLRPGLEREFHGQPPHVAYSSLCGMCGQLLLLRDFVEQQIQKLPTHALGSHLKEADNRLGIASSWIGTAPLNAVSRGNLMISSPLYPLGAAPCVRSTVGDSSSLLMRTKNTMEKTVRGAGQAIHSGPPQSTGVQRNVSDSRSSARGTSSEKPTKAHNRRRKAADILSAKTTLKRLRF